MYKLLFAFPHLLRTCREARREELRNLLKNCQTFEVILMTGQTREPGLRADFNVHRGHLGIVLECRFWITGLGILSFQPAPRWG